MGLDRLNPLSGLFYHFEGPPLGAVAVNAVYKQNDRFRSGVTPANSGPLGGWTYPNQVVEEREGEWWNLYPRSGRVGK